MKRIGLSFRDLRKKLNAMPATVSQAVAREVAPDLSARVAGAWDAGRTVYGDARPVGVDGRKLTLNRTGLARTMAVFTAVGTIVRSAIGPTYVKYLIGKYKVMPIGNAAMPAAWKRAIDAAVARVMQNERRAA